MVRYGGRWRFDGGPKLTHEHKIQNPTKFLKQTPPQGEREREDSAVVAANDVWWCGRVRQERERSDDNYRERKCMSFIMKQ